MRRPRIETFDLNLLRVFDALYQHGSVNAAAVEIGISASAISHALGRLRDIFNDDLFVKGSGGMIPTASATEISDRVAAALFQVRSLLEPTEFKFETAERHFKVRCHHYASWLFLPLVMQRLREQAPGVQLTVHCDDRKGIADDLDTGLVDLVINTFHHIPTRFDSEVILSDRWVWAMRADHPALTTELSSDDLLRLPQLVLASNEVGRSIDGVVTDAGLEQEVVADKWYLGDTSTTSKYSAKIKGILIVNSIFGAPAILQHSDMVALLPAGYANIMAPRHGLKVIEYDREGPTIDHHMIWHQKHGRDPGAAWLRSIFRSAFPPPPA